MGRKLTGEANRFENGRIEIEGEGTYKVISNTNAVLPLDNDEVIVEGLPGTIAEGKSYKIYDDDEQYVPSSHRLPIDASTSFVTEFVHDRYRGAYIEIDTTQPNPNRIVPFTRNKLPPVSSGRDLVDSNDFWACRVVAALQPLASEDGDPDSENNDAVEGEYKGGDALIYLEVVRETYKALLANPNQQSLGLSRMNEYRDGLVAHEIGHGPLNDGQGGFDSAVNENVGPDHFELGLMTSSLGRGHEAEFSSKTLRRFRKANKWND